VRPLAGISVGVASGNLCAARAAGKPGHDVGITHSGVDTPDRRLNALQGFAANHAGEPVVVDLHHFCSGRAESNLFRCAAKAGDRCEMDISNTAFKND